MMTPISVLDHWVKSRPKHVAFIARNETWSYQRLAIEVDRTAIPRNGLGKIDRKSLPATIASAAAEALPAS